MRVDVGGRGWMWVGVDGTWMDGDADVGDYRVECKGNKTYLMYGGQPACDCPMTLKIVVVIVVQWWRRLTVDVQTDMLQFGYIACDVNG